MTDFGKDTVCVPTLRTGRYVTGVRLVAQAAYCRITTRRGSILGNEAEANYGIDVRDGIGASDARAYAAALPGRVEAELLKDERIQTVNATAVVVNAGPLVEVHLTVSCETSEGPFTLTVSVTAARVAILGIEA